MTSPVNSSTQSSTGSIALDSSATADNGDNHRGIDIRAGRLQHWFGEGENAHHALKSNTLQISNGEVVIMTGPSGSGKTTLLTLIGALRSVQPGRQTEENPLEVLGVPLSGATQDDIIALRRRIGFIFQHHNLFESLTAVQNIMMGAEVLAKNDLHKKKKEAVELLRRLDLGDRTQYKPGNLSGGQKQRVAVCRALINHPDLILADEPTAALDEKSSLQVVQLLKERAQNGATVMIVTHDNRILEYADRMVRMEDGMIKRNRLVQLTLDICRYLQECEDFRGQPLEVLMDLADRLVPDEKVYEPGMEIIRQGDTGDRMFVIRRGSVDVFRTTDGETNQVNEQPLGKGAIFGEAALVRNVPRNATVKAREKTEVYYLSKEDFDHILKELPSFDKQVQNLLFDRR